MKIGTRIYFTLYMLALLALFTYTGLAAFGVIPADEVLFAMRIFGEDKGRIFWAAGCAAVVLLGIPLLFFRSKKSVRMNGVQIGDKDNGGVFMTASALEDMCRRYLDTVNGISVLGIRVLPTEEKTLKIDLKISAKPGTVVPEVTEQIDAGIRSFIKEFSGVTVQGVSTVILPYKEKTEQ